MLSKLFGKKDPAQSYSEAELVDAGVCPNCWGKQAYQGQFRDYVIDRGMANNGDVPGKKAFIQQFVQDRITGIRLKSNENGQSCEACQTNYQS